MKPETMIALCVLPFVALARKAVKGVPEGTMAMAGKSASCDSHLCSHGYAARTNFDEIVLEASDQNCCVPTCILWNCPAGWSADPDYINNVGQSNAECCDKLCSQFGSCPDLTGIDPKKRNQPGVTQAECCSSTCEVYNCFGNWVADLENKQYVVAATDEECCRPSCLSVTCDPSHSLVPHPDRGTKAGNTTEYCCQKTCGYYKSQCDSHTGVPEEKLMKVPSSSTVQGVLHECCDAKCSGHTCASGYSLLPQNLNHFIAKGQGECCEKTCKAFTCSHGFVKVPDHENFTQPSDIDCCENTCANFVCPFGYFPSINPAKLHVTDRSNENCCEKNCADMHVHCGPGKTLRPSPETVSADSLDFAASCCESITCKELRDERTPISMQQGVSTAGLDCHDFSPVDKNCSSRYKLFNMSGHVSAVPCIMDDAVGICKNDDTRLAKNCSDFPLSENAEM